MRYIDIIFGFFCSVMTLSLVILSSDAHSKELPKHNEYSFQCGAVYGILWKIYQEKPDAEKATLYKSRFDILAAKAEQEFMSKGRTASDAQAYLQQYADDITNRSLADKRVLPSLLKICDKVLY